MSSDAPRPIVRLNGDRHESVLTERDGLFRVLCGCHWASPFGTVTEAEAAYDEHLRLAALDA